MKTVGSWGWRITPGCRADIPPGISGRTLSVGKASTIKGEYNQLNGYERRHP